MATANTTEPTQVVSQASKSKKNKKKKNKGINKANGDSSHVNGTESQAEDDIEEDDEAGPGTPILPQPSESDLGQPTTGNITNSNDGSSNSSDVDSTGARLEAAAKERDQLRVEVVAIRKSLENIQQKHDLDKADLSKQLEDAKLGKDHADSKYQKLLGQVNTIKSTLHERLKADAEELAKANSRIEELEGETKTRSEHNHNLQKELDQTRSDFDARKEELESVRSRTTTSQQNWAKERDELAAREVRAREEFEAARQAMQDWEALATEERNLREGMEERVGELEEHLSSQREAFEQASAERESQNTTVDGLQRALRDIHDARKQERRELVESAQSQQDSLQKQLSEAERLLQAAQSDVEKGRADLERAAPFEREVREKNLLIGKLRQEAIILNDHLTKALRFLKRGKKDDQVDRQLVTNYLLHFLALDRTDPKKFQVLQLISSILGWSEEQQEQAGLARPGASSQTILKVPLSSPFRRVSSSAALSPISSPSSNPWSPGGSGGDAAGRESLAELWSEFLEREAEEATPRPANSGLQSGPHGSSTGNSNPMTPIRK